MELKDLFESQKKLAIRIGYPLEHLDIKTIETLTQHYVLAMHVELDEFIEWTNWKKWKKTRVEYDDERIKELQVELIDLLHFWISLCILWEVTPEKVFDLYFEKNKENHNRQDRGY